MWKVKSDLSEDHFAEDIFFENWLQDKWDEADLQIDIANNKLYFAKETAKNPEVITTCLMLVERIKSLEISIFSKLDVIYKELAVVDLPKFSVTGFAAMLADA